MVGTTEGFPHRPLLLSVHSNTILAFLQGFLIVHCSLSQSFSLAVSGDGVVDKRWKIWL